MSVGFTHWASGIRTRMAADPGRADFKDQVQCNGYLFLHEYLDDVLNAPRPDNVIEFTKTPGRNKTASKKARALHASALKLKPVTPITFAPGPKDKENDASVTSPKQLFKPALRSQPNHPEPIAETAGPRDSISRATPARSAVPVFSPANATGALPTPSDDPLSPFRDATALSKEQPTSLQVTAQEIFTTKLVIPPSSPAHSEKELPSAPADEPTKASEPVDQDLSIIQEDDEGQSVAGFEDAREDFTDARSVTTAEGDVTEVAIESAPTPVRQRLPSPPASEDIPTSASEPPTPVRQAEHEPTEPITSTNVTVADIFDNAPAPVALPATAPAVEPTKKSLPNATSQPTPPPEPATATTIPTVTSPRPLPIPPSRPNSSLGVQQPLRPPSFAQPIHPSSAVPTAQPAANIPRASSTIPRNPFSGPSLKDFRREPSVSGNAHRELRQSSWRKKPDGTGAVTATTSIGSATTDSDPSRLKRKSSALQMPAHPPPSKSQKLSRGSSPSSGSSSEDETEMQVPLKDEDGGSWNTGTSMLDDLRNRLARLEKSTNGKTPGTSRVWTPTMSNASLPDTGSEKRLSLSDLSVRPASGSGSAEKGKAKEPEVIGLDLGLSTDDPTSSMLSNRSTTPVDSPPQTRRVLPDPPVFALPEPAPAPTKAPEAPKAASTNIADAVRAAKAEAARLFGGTKFTAPPVRTETQSTVVTEVSSVFDKATQSQSQFTQSTAATLLESQDAEMEDELDADLDLDLDPDVDVDGDEDMDVEGDDDDAKTTSSRISTAQTRSMVKQGPVKSIQQAGAAKKAADEQAGKASRLREMEERRQAAALRKAEEEKSRTLESEKKRKEREELAASKNVKAPVKKAVEDPNKKRKLEAETKAAGKKPAVPSNLAQSTVAAPTTSSSTKSRIAKPTTTAGPGPSSLKSAMKSTTNPFQPAPPPSTTKTLKPATSSSSLKATAAKKAKGSISDAPGQALQQQMQARVQAQLKAAQKEPEIQSENIELPDINSEYSDSDDEDRGKDFPSWTQDQALMDALRSQESFNPDALFGPIQPLKMGDLFKTGHSRFRKRTSSANWAGTDGITVEEEIEYARRMGYINQ